MTTPVRLFDRLQLLLLIAGLAACSSYSREVDLPPQTLNEAASLEEEWADELSADSADSEEGVDESSAAAPPSPESEADHPVGGESDRTRVQTVVIRASKEPAVTPQSLFEASQAERRRRETDDRPTVVINDENLAELAAGGHLTVAETGSTEAGSPAAAEGVRRDPSSTPSSAGRPTQGPPATEDRTGPPAAAQMTQEEYWRNRVLQLRLGWKATVEETAEIEAEVAGLRTRFYAEDDPFYRDNEIKPAWDRALQALELSKQRAEDYQKKLELLLDEGRRAGAHPGWLREGIEYEPVKPRSRAHDGPDPREPKIVDEKDWEP